MNQRITMGVLLALCACDEAQLETSGADRADAGADRIDGSTAAVDAAPPDAAPLPDGGPCFPLDEVCDGVDNDCDGELDEAVREACYEGDPAELDAPATACRPGTRGCDEGCVDEVRPALVDLCNQINDDCDDAVDEDCVCTDGEPCVGDTTGRCDPGTQVCQGDDLLACADAFDPVPETCDGTDEDCDGRADEDASRPCFDGPPEARGLGICADGIETCVDGEFAGCQGAIWPQGEACNGVDEDCDGRTDEDLDGGVCDTGAPGVCGAGVERCVEGETRCVAEQQAVDEVCDGLDNDCDGATDEDADTEQPCATDAPGRCAPGALRCRAGVLTCVGLEAPGVETCDAVDEDCDGAVDEGDVAERCYEGADLTLDVGPCQAGRRACADGLLGPCVGQVLPQPEACNQVDDDCDGQIDEVEGGCLCDPGASRGCGVDPALDGVGRCRRGEQRCVRDGAGWGRCVDAIAPAVEVCNGVDDDCDGSSDEVEGAGEPCAVGRGACRVEGRRACIDGELACDARAAPPGDELCNGVDDDCNGVVDDVADLGNVCDRGQGACRRRGGRVCDFAGERLVCDATPGDPAPETCDGADEDCDGTVDEGVPGVGEACSAGRGACRREGRRACDGAQVRCDARPGEPGAEQCNGADDDCDGRTDEAIPGVGDGCSVGRGACRALGTQQCADGRLACDAEPNAPAPEVCNGADDDCDGRNDEGVPGVGEPCSAGRGACRRDGARVCRGDRVVCDAQAAPPRDEVCDNGADDDCDGQVDEDCAPPPAGCQDQVRPSVGALGAPQQRRRFGDGGGFRGSPLVVDIDGAPAIVSSGFTNMRVHRLDGGQLWSGRIEGRNYSGTILADLDGDGTPELVAGDNRGRVRAWNLAGQVVQGWPFRVSGDVSIRSLMADDLDGDGADEVIVYSTLTDSPPGAANPNMYVLGPRAQVRDGWPHYRDGDPHAGRACVWCGGFNMNVAVGDLEGDGQKELVFAQDRFSISIFHPDGTPQLAHRGTFSWCGEGPLHWGEVRAYLPEAAERTGICDEHQSIVEFTYSPPLLADVDGNGDLEVLAVGNVERPVGTTTVSALTVYRPDRRWLPGFEQYKRSQGYLGEGWPIEVNPTVVAANVTGGPGLELIVTHLDGFLTAYDNQGERLWRTRYADRPCVATEPVVADLDADGAPEILVFASCDAEGRARMLVVNGDGQVRLDQQMPFATFAAPTLVDLEGDGDLEMVVQASNWQPNIYIYDWPASDAECLVWSTGRGDRRHRGRLR